MSEFNFLSSEELEEESIDSRITVLHGVSGSGKSSLALSASKTNKILYIDLEGVYRQIKKDIPHNINEANITSWKPRTLRSVIELFQSQERLSFDLIILDSVSFLTQNEFATERHKSKDNRNIYGTLIDDFIELTKEIQLGDMQVLFVCHSSQESDTDGGPKKWMPSTKTKKLTANMIDRATNIIFLDTERVVTEEKTTELYQLYCDRFSSFAKGKKRDSDIPNLIEKENLVWQDIEKYFTKPAEQKKVSEETLKTLQKEISNSHKAKPLDMDKMFIASKIKKSQLEDLSNRNAKILIGKVQRRTEGLQK